MDNSWTLARRLRAGAVVVAMSACLWPAAAHAQPRVRDVAPGQDRIARPMAEARELGAILEGLERGIDALRRLDRMDAAEHLERIADEVRGARRQAMERAERSRRADAEPGDRHEAQSHARAALELMRLAMPALREGQRHDAVEQVERALHAMELAEAGHLEAAREAQQGLPDRDRYRAIMRLAAHLYDERGMHDRADAVRRMTQELLEGKGAHDAPAPREDAPRRAELARQLEVARIALHGLREAGRERAAAAMERWLEARAAQLELGTPPPPGAIPPVPARIELLEMGARAWDELGHERKASAVRDLTRVYVDAMDALPDRDDADRRPPGRDEAPAGAERRVRKLQAEVRALQEALRRIEAELHAMHEGQAR